MRQFLLFLMMIFLALATALNTWASERHYTFEDDKAWEVVTGKWEIKNSEYHQTKKDAQEAIVLLKKSEGIDTADLESISVKAYDLGTGTWQNIFIVFGHDGKSDNYYLGGVFVGGRQGWAFDPIATKDNKRGAEILVAPCDPKCPPEKWFDIRIEFKNGEAILSGGETGGKIKAMARHKFGKIQGGRVGLGASQSVVKYKDFIVAGKGVQTSVSPQGRITTTWTNIKSASK